MESLCKRLKITLLFLLIANKICLNYQIFSIIQNGRHTNQIIVFGGEGNFGITWIVNEGRITFLNISKISSKNFKKFGKSKKKKKIVLIS